MPISIIRIDRSDNHLYPNGFPKWHEPYAEPIHITTLCRPVCVCLHYTGFYRAHQAKQITATVFPPIMPSWSSASKDSSPFLNRVRAACRRKGYTYRTEKTYLRWIVRYVKYHGTQHPRAFGKSKVRDYLSYLATERTVAASTQNQALNALLFLHRDVLGADWDEVSDFDRARSRTGFRWSSPEKKSRRCSSRWTARTGSWPTCFTGRAFGSRRRFGSG